MMAKFQLNVVKCVSLTANKIQEDVVELSFVELNVAQVCCRQSCYSLRCLGSLVPRAL